MTTKTYDVLDRPEVGSVLFYPRRDFGMPPEERNIFTVRIPVSEGVSIGGRLYLAGSTAPIIVYFHGNGEIASDYNSIAPLYTGLGISLLVVDYRGYGISNGRPTASALINDAVLCWQQAPRILADKQAQPEAMYVMGRSLGSAAALEIAAQANSNLSGLIIESGFAYTFALVERIGFVQLPDAFEQQDGFGNLEKIARIDAPTLILHGDRDLLIPVTDAVALYEASPSRRKTLLRIPGAGHNDLMLIGQREYFAAIAAFCGQQSAA